MTGSTIATSTSTSTSTTMKLALVACVTMPLAVAAFSTHSSFTAAAGNFQRSNSHSSSRAFTTRPNRASSSLVMYDASRDPPSSPELNAWQVLATTERWICSTLAAAETGAGNPYSRKEVSYVCEPQKDAALIVAGIFRRLKESREEGESHGATEEARAVDQGDEYNPHTLRQTQVIVIPGNTGLVDSFPVFDGLIESINRARRNARDYVTDTKLEKLDADDHHLSDSEWSVSVNCAHLHPDFGKRTAQEILKEMQEQEASGEEIDLVYEAYQAKKLLARQSPFPTIVIEVRASPPPDFGDAPPPQPPASHKAAQDQDDQVSSDDIQKLEALFGKSAHIGSKSGDDDFYDAIGYTIGESLSAATPLQMAQQWALDNDPHVSEKSAFTESRTAQVDEAYEFIFTNIAMLCESKAKGAVERQYLVMPHFLSAAATSFEKFSKEVETMIGHLPDLKDKVAITTFHPEHVESTKRSPVPLFVLQWKKQN